MNKTLSLLATHAFIALTSLIIGACGSPQKKEAPPQVVQTTREGEYGDEMLFTSEIQDAIDQKKPIYSIVFEPADIINMDTSSVWGTDPIQYFCEDVAKSKGMLSARYKGEDEFREALRKEPEAVYDMAASDFPGLFRDFEDFSKVLCINRKLAVYYKAPRENDWWCVETVGYSRGEMVEADVVTFLPKKIWEPSISERPFFIKDDGTRIIECELISMEVDREQMAKNTIKP